MLRSIETDKFGEWIEKLLSLDGLKATDRLDAVLDEVENHTLSIEEIKRAFSMYVAGRFPLEPRDNYLTVIHFSKVVNCYVQEMNKKNKFKEQESENKSHEEIEFIMIEATDRIEKEYKANKEITGTYTHVYDYLFAKGLLPQHTNKFKSGILVKAKAIAKSDAMTKAGSDFNFHQQLKTTLQDIDNNEHDSIKTISKRLVLEEYFKNN